MALFHNPQIITSGLVFAYDSVNRKSYQGPPIQNKLTSISPLTASGTGYSFVGGTEVSDIPTVGPTLVQYSNIQNNYSAVSSWCCPNPFSYGGGIPVSGSTLYTYGIVYRIESGYTNANYMYRYEYNGGTYVTESGVHSDSNRIHLGNGWYWAWGTFTTQASTTQLNGLASFYYRYSTAYDKLSVAKVLLVQGDYTGLHPRYWPDVNTTRSTTQAIVDLTGKNTLTASSLTYSNNGQFSFNGSGNYIDVTGSGFTSGMSTYTISHWSRRDVESRMPVAGRTSTAFYQYGDNSWAYTHGGTWGEYYYPKAASIPLGTYGFYCIVYNGSNVAIYRNGYLEGTQSTTGTADWSQGLRIGYWAGGGSYAYSGKIDSVKFYNRALSAAEVTQEFNALRGRYGL